MRVDHVALAVRDLEAAAERFRTLGCAELYRERVAEQGVDIVGVVCGEIVIELLKPFSADSPIERFRGAAESKLHHVAFAVEDVRAELARLKAAGIRLIDETPRQGAHGNTIAFLHPKSTGGVLLELCRREPGSRA